MNAATGTLPWIFASCFGLSVASAIVPWLNAEVVIVSCAALLRSPSELLALTVVASAGQMVGKCGLYWFGFSAVKLTGKSSERIERWRARLAGGHRRSAALVFVSSAVGIPPLYVTTLAAGAVRMTFSRFVGAAACGRLVRFGALVFCSDALLRLWR